MATDEASIRMTVDSSEAITENQKYIRAATETFNMLKQKSQELGISEKQRIQWMEREVELMKERSRLSTAETVNRLYEDPKLSTKDRAQFVRSTRAEGREDIEELKLVNKQLKQQSENQKVAEQKAERLGQSFSGMAIGMLSSETAAGAAGAAGSGVLGALGVGGVLGILAAILISKGLKGAATMEPALRDYSILTGQELGGASLKADVKGMSLDRLSNLGMKPSEYYTKYSQLTRAGAGVVNEDMLGIIAGEKAKGVSLAGVMGVERYGEGKVTNIERYFERYLRATSQHIAVLPEILQAFTGEASRMIRVSGKVDSAEIAASIATLSKGFGLKGEPLQNIYAAMNQGLQQSTNPVIQAMQYSAMNRALGPGASLWQMQKAMEKPMENPKYIANMMDLARKTSVGGQEGYARNLQQLLGITASQADLLSRGKYSPEMFAKEEAAFKETGIGGYEKEAETRFGALEKLTSKLQGQFEQKGYATSESFMGDINKLFGEEGTINKGVNAVKDLKDKVVAAIERYEHRTDSVEMEAKKEWEEHKERRREQKQAEKDQKLLLQQIADSLVHR